jgi:cellobiose-specific phosphotransferase system component IIC
LPGSLAGLAAGIPRTRGISAAILTAVIALLAGLIAEHAVAPFVADPSLGYFLTHVGDLRPVTLGLIGLGAAIGFYVPFRRRVA